MADLTQYRFDRAVTALVYALECEAATYGELMSRKSTSKSDLKRHRMICANALLKLYELEPETYHLQACPRVAAFLKSANKMCGHFGEYQQKTGKCTQDVFAEFVDDYFRPFYGEPRA